MVLPRFNHRVVFASAVFLLLVCGSTLGWMLYRIYFGEEWVRHSYNVQLLIAEIESDLSRTGRVRQTYLQTKDDRYLRDIEETRTDLFKNLDQLQSMVKDNPDAGRASGALEETIKGRFLTFDESLRLFESGSSTL